jgi:hypothetical protein
MWPAPSAFGRCLLGSLSQAKQGGTTMASWQRPAKEWPLVPKKMDRIGPVSDRALLNHRPGLFCRPPRASQHQGCTRWTGKSYRKSTCTVDAHELHAREDREPFTSCMREFVVTAECNERGRSRGRQRPSRRAGAETCSGSVPSLPARDPCPDFGFFCLDPSVPRGATAHDVQPSVTSNVRWLQKSPHSPGSGDRASFVRPT